MLKVDQVSIIRDRHFNLQQSVRMIARELKLSRNTVKKYLEGTPVRKPRKARESPVRDEAQEKVVELLEAWGERTTEKQAITGTRLHHELRKGGLDVGVTTVREILADHKRDEAEVFVPLVHRAGEEAQVDFFEVDLDIGGKRLKAWKFLVRLMYSGRDFAWLYPHCDQVSFLDGHVRAFAHFAGVPLRLVYDNLSAAVAKIVMGVRQLTARFKALVEHYRFEHSFCRPGEGHDKGGVEARGKGIRLEHLTPIPQADSILAASHELLSAIDARLVERRDAQGRSCLERFLVEVPVFKPLPGGEFEPRKVLPVSISSQALVRVEGGDYSVPEGWARLPGTAYFGPYDVTITCRLGNIVKDRVPKGEKNIQYRHYLRELSRKPQAVRQVAPELVTELGKPFDRLWEMLVAAHGQMDGARALSKVLGAILVHGENAVREAVTAGLTADRFDLLALKGELHGPRVRSVPVPPALAGYEVEEARATDYDYLLAEAV